MKKIYISLFLLITFALQLFICKTPVYALSNDDWEYIINKDNSITITNYKGSHTIVEVPASIDEKTVTRIEGYEYYSIKDITFPSTIEFIDQSVFYRGLIENIRVNNNNTHYKSVDGVLFTNNMEELISYPMGNSRDSYQIPKGVKKITFNAFATTIYNGKTSLENIEIPSSVTIVEDIHSLVSRIAYINVDHDNTTYKSIDGVLFSKSGDKLICYPYGNKRTEYSVPEGTKEIAYNAFSDTYGILHYLSTLRIPASLEVFPDGFQIEKLQNIIVDSSNPKFSSIEGVLFSKDKQTLISYPMGNLRSSYVIPTGVTKVEYGAFYDIYQYPNHLLRNITMPASLIEFENCLNIGLENFFIDENHPSIKSISGVIFSKDGKQLVKYPRLKQDIRYNIPEGTQSVKSNAFFSCNYLKTLIIPNSVTELNQNSIDFNEELTDILIYNNNIQICDYNFNSRIIITLYGSNDSNIHDYALSNKLPFRSIDEFFNADLSDLTLIYGSIGSPVSITVTTATYMLDVGNDVTGITITPTAKVGNATIKVNGMTFPSGKTSERINLNEGENSITVEVIARDGVTTKSYIVKVIRGVSEKVTRVTVLANSEACGTVSGGGNYNKGTLVTVTASAYSGYYFTNWTQNGVMASNSSTYTFTVDGADEILVANFIPISLGVYTGTITGTVTDGTNPIANVNMSTIVSGSVYSAVTSADGRYSIENVPVGTGYTVTASKEGYNDVSISNVNVLANTTTSGVNIILRKIPITHTVTFNNNGGDTNASPTMKSVVSGSNIGTLPVDPSKLGYTFTGWNTSQNGSGVAFIATTAVTADVTVYAQWAANNTIGSPGGGGGAASNSIDLSKAYFDQSKGGLNVLNIINKDNTTKVEVSIDSIKNALTDIKQPTFKLDLTKGDKALTTVTTFIPSKVFTQMQEKSVKGIEIKTNLATVIVPTDIFDVSDSENVSVKINKVDCTTLNDKQKEIVGNAPVFEFSIDALDKWDFSVGKKAFNKLVKVTIPYTANMGTDMEKITVYYIDENGKVENKQGTYNADSQTISFTAEHFSSYFIKENSVSFSDLKDYEKYAPYINVMASKDIIAGTGEGNFSPANNLSRAEFSKLLVAMLKLDKVNINLRRNTFMDVNSDDWFYNYANIAYTTGLVQGYSETEFAPNDTITYQDLCSIIVRALKYIGRDVTIDSSKNLPYTNKDKFADYAKDPIAYLTSIEVISANSDGSFSATEKVNRAEAAKILYLLYNNINK